MTVGELEQKLTAKELREWLEFWNEQGGFGFDRADFRSGLICQTIAASSGAKKKGGGDWTVADFMPLQPREPQVITLDHLKEIFGDQLQRKSDIAE